MYCALFETSSIIVLKQLSKFLSIYIDYILAKDCVLALLCKMISVVYFSVIKCLNFCALLFHQH